MEDPSPSSTLSEALANFGTRSMLTHRECFRMLRKSLGRAKLNLFINFKGAKDKSDIECVFKTRVDSETWILSIGRGSDESIAKLVASVIAVKMFLERKTPVKASEAFDGDEEEIQHELAYGPTGEEQIYNIGSKTLKSMVWVRGPLGRQGGQRQQPLLNLPFGAGRESINTMKQGDRFNPHCMSFIRRDLLKKIRNIVIQRMSRSENAKLFSSVTRGQRHSASSDTDFLIHQVAVLLRYSSDENKEEEETSHRSERVDEEEPKNQNELYVPPSNSSNETSNIQDIDVNNLSIRDVLEIHLKRFGGRR